MWFNRQSGQSNTSLATLASTITSTATTIPVSNASYLSTTGFIKIGSEVMSYSNVTGNDLINVNRGRLPREVVIAFDKASEKINSFNNFLRVYGLLEALINPKTKLPTFEYENYTMGANDSENIKTFARTISKNLPGGEEEIKVIGKGSKAFRELFGEVEDARYSIFEGIGKLSAIARKNQLFDEILNVDDVMKTSVTKDTPYGQRGFFFDSKSEARRNLPNSDIVKIDPYVKEYFNDGVLINRLQGKYTTKEIAESFNNSSKLTEFMRGESGGLFEKGASWLWRNLFLHVSSGSNAMRCCSVSLGTFSLSLSLSLTHSLSLSLSGKSIMA
jgi:hypothetical protein